MNFTFTIYCDINITAIIIRAIAFTPKTNVLYYTYKLWDSSVTRTDTIKDLGIQLDSILHFRAHVRRYFLPIRKDTGLNRSITYSFATLDSLLILYFNLARPKLKYSSNVWSSVTSTDAEKLDRFQRKLVVLCQCLFPTNVHVTDEGILKFRKLLALHNRRRFFDVLYISVCSGLNVARLFRILLVFEVFLSNLRTPPGFLLFTKPLRLLDVFRLLTICAWTSISLGNHHYCKTNSSLICDIFITTYLCFFAVKVSCPIAYLVFFLVVLFLFCFFSVFGY
jgi:hypothetical protein